MKDLAGINDLYFDLHASVSMGYVYSYLQLHMTWTVLFLQTVEFKICFDKSPNFFEKVFCSD